MKLFKKPTEEERFIKKKLRKMNRKNRKISLKLLEDYKNGKILKVVGVNEEVKNGEISNQI